MCTLSIWHERDGAGYRLWFNRDEKHARAAESPPRGGMSAGGVCFVAPRDGERGGTWLLLNELGLTVCVLNDYESGGATPGRRSRGELPFFAAAAADAHEALAAVRRAAGDAADFAPFKLVAVDLRGAARALEWDGRRLAERDEIEFATSSSFAPAEVRRAREAARAALAERVSARGLEALHWNHEPAAGAWSLRMRRADAHTRSVCAVSVRAEGGALAASLRHTLVDWSRADGAGESVEVRL